MDTNNNHNPRKLLYLGKRGIYSTWDKNQSVSVNEDGSTINSAIKRSRTAMRKKTVEEYNKDEVISPFHEKQILQPINISGSNDKEGFINPSSIANNGTNQKSSKNKKKDKELFRTTLVKIIMQYQDTNDIQNIQQNLEKILEDQYQTKKKI